MSKAVRVRKKVPLLERKRTTKACTECQKRRIKCMGSIPCDPCKTKARNCVIESKVSRTSLTMSIAELKEYNCKLERVLLASNTQLTLEHLRNNIDKFERSIIATGRFNGPHEVPDENVVAQMLKNMASTSDQSFISFMKSEESPTGEFNHNVKNIPIQLLSECIRLLPSVSRMLKLLDVYFDVCETNYFYVHPRKIYTIVKDLYDNLADMEYVTEHWIYLIYLMSVLSIATCYEYIRDDSVMPCTSEKYLWEDPGYSYFLLILPFAGYLMHNNNVQSIQIFQLMGVYMTTKRVDILSLCVDHGYRYMTLAVEIAVSNKLHLEETYVDKSNEEKEFCKRLWWSCYCLERRLGLNLEKSEIVSLKEITVLLPTYVPLLCHLDGTSNWANQRSLIEVINIFGNISDLVYRSNRDSNITISSKTVRQVSFQLDTWKDVLQERRSREAQLQIKAQCRNYRANTHLDLFYYLGKIYLGKPFLLYQVENHELLQREPKSAECLFISYMTSVCIDAAYNIFDILTAMKNKNQLAIYSSTDLNFCNIGLFVMVAFLKIDLSASTKSFLRKGLRLLKVLSKGSSSAKVNISMFAKFEKTVGELEIDELVVDTTPGLFPDRDVDIYTSQLQLDTMGSLPPARSGNTGYAGQIFNYAFPEELFVNCDLE